LNCPQISYEGCIVILSGIKPHLLGRPARNLATVLTAWPSKQTDAPS